MIYKSRNNKLNYQVDLIKKVVEFVGEQLHISSELLEDLVIHYKKLPSNVGGQLVLSNSGFVEIQISTDVSFSYGVSKLCHELVHLKQFEDGRLAYSDKNTVRWRHSDGVLREHRLLHSRNTEDSFKAYQDQPWEKEAYELENKIFELCKHKFKNYKFMISPEIEITAF